MKTARLVSTMALALAMTVQPMAAGVAQNGKPKFDHAVVDTALKRVSSLPEVIYIVDKLARTAANPADVYLRALDLFPEYKLSIIALAHATSVEIPIIIDILDVEPEPQEATEPKPDGEIAFVSPQPEQKSVTARPVIVVESPKTEPRSPSIEWDSADAEEASHEKPVAPMESKQISHKVAEKTIAVSLPGGFSQIKAPVEPKVDVPEIAKSETEMSAREFTLGDVSLEKVFVGTSIAAIVGGLLYVAFDGSEGQGASDEEDAETDGGVTSLSRINAAASVAPTKVSLLMPFGPDRNGTLTFASAGVSYDVVTGSVGSRSLDVDIGGNPFVTEDDSARSVAFDLEGREFAVSIGEDVSAFRSSLTLESELGDIEFATGFVHAKAIAGDVFTSFVGAEMDWSVTNKWSLQPSGIAAVTQEGGDAGLSAVLAVDLVGREIITKKDEVVFSISRTFDNSSANAPVRGSIDDGLGLSVSWSTPVGDDARLSMALSHHMPIESNRDESSSLMVGFGLRF